MENKYKFCVCFLALCAFMSYKVIPAELCVEIFASTMPQMALRFACKKKQIHKNPTLNYFA